MSEPSILSERRAALIVGAGEGIGAALARAFAAAAYDVCLVRRPRHADALEKLATTIREGGGAAHAFPADARDEEAMVSVFDRIEREVAPLEVVIFNIGANVSFPIADTTAQVFRKVWEMACYAGFLTGREAAKRMAPRGGGTIIFTGATASLRGAASFSAFASAKMGLRAIAQSMARELGPRNIHVAHVVVDGAVDGEFIRSQLNDAAALQAEDAILDPDAIAAAYLALHRQPRSAWTHELDLRPWKETW